LLAWSPPTPVALLLSKSAETARVSPSPLIARFAPKLSLASGFEALT